MPASRPLSLGDIKDSIQATKNATGYGPSSSSGAIQHGLLTGKMQWQSVNHRLRAGTVDGQKQTTTLMSLRNSMGIAPRPKGRARRSPPSAAQTDTTPANSNAPTVEQPTLTPATPTPDENSKPAAPRGTGASKFVQVPEGHRWDPVKQKLVSKNIPKNPRTQNKKAQNAGKDKNKNVAKIDGKPVTYDDVVNSIQAYHDALDKGPTSASGIVKYGDRLKGKTHWVTVEDWLKKCRIAGLEEKATLASIKKKIGLKPSPAEGANKNNLTNLTLCNRAQLVETIAFYYAEKGVMPRSCLEEIGHGRLKSNDWSDVILKMNDGFVDGIPARTDFKEFLKQPDVRAEIATYINPKKGHPIHARAVFNHMAQYMRGQDAVDLDDAVEIGGWKVGDLKTAFKTQRVIEISQEIMKGRPSITLEEYMVATQIITKDDATEKLLPGPAILEAA